MTRTAFAAQMFDAAQPAGAVARPASLRRTFFANQYVTARDTFRGHCRYDHLHRTIRQRCLRQGGVAWVMMVEHLTEVALVDCLAEFGAVEEVFRFVGGLTASTLPDDRLAARQFVEIAVTSASQLFRLAFKRLAVVSEAANEFAHPLELQVELVGEILDLIFIAARDQAAVGLADVLLVVCHCFILRFGRNARDPGEVPSSITDVQKSMIRGNSSSRR